MSTWQQLVEEEPELAAAVRARFESARHHVLATLRSDGAPRVSGTEVVFRRTPDGEQVLLGSMPGSRKALDLLRDPRMALHAHLGDGSMAGGDAKLSGRAVAVHDDALLTQLLKGAPGGEGHFFLVEPSSVVLTCVEGDHLLIRLWRPGRGVATMERR